MANKITIKEALQSAAEKSYSSATETLYFKLIALLEEGVEGYTDGEDEDGESFYDNCKVTLTITHKGETISI